MTYIKKDGYCFATQSSMPILNDRVSVREQIDWDIDFHVGKWGHRIIFAYDSRSGWKWWIDSMPQICGCIYVTREEPCDCLKDPADKVLGLPNYDKGIRGAATDVSGYLFDMVWVSKEEFISKIEALLPTLRREANKLEV